MADNKTALTRADLKRFWQVTYGAAPPKGINGKTLNLAYAYQQQAQHHGGLNPEIKKQLYRIARSDTPLLPSVASRQVRPGARLVRQWHGNAYVVDVLENGFMWQGRIYRSLSKIAGVITGTRWSGPRFFGVKP